MNKYVPISYSISLYVTHFFDDDPRQTSLLFHFVHPCVAEHVQLMITQLFEDFHVHVYDDDAREKKGQQGRQYLRSDK